MALLVGCVLLSALAFGVSNAAATEPPVLESLSISPTAVNVTEGSEQVTVTAHITDSCGPGVGYAFLASRAAGGRAAPANRRR
jgi:hypothetical protein